MLGLCDRMLWYSRNVHDNMADGETAFEKRSGQTFYGPSIPSRTLSEYIPITSKNKQFGKKTMNGICSGFVLRAGEGW